jgi:macrolide transport system ATP-binding/permease protein
MVAVGDGAREAVRKQIESLGTNVVVILPCFSFKGGDRDGLARRAMADEAECGRNRASQAGGRLKYMIIKFFGP